MKVGQKVWVKEYGKPNLYESEITKVGRKYVYIKSYSREERFHKENLVEVENWGRGKCLYLSKSDYLNEVELEKNIGEIRQFFNSLERVDITLEQSRQILKKLEGESNEEYLDR